jgi:O-antigen ligase
VTAQALRSPAVADPIAPLRGVLFVAILLLGWVSVHPFQSMADQKLITIGDTSDLVNQFAYLTLGALAAGYVLLGGARRLRLLAQPLYAAMLAWLVVSVATSNDPALSFKRLVFALLVILLAAVAPLLPTTMRRFADMMAAIAVAVLVLCYAGLLFAPHVAIHQPDDLVEPTLAGNWRGLFDHKNIAGPMMVNLIFVGLFVAKRRNLALGAAIMVAAAIFLYFCEAKAAIQLLPVVLVLSFAMMRLRSALLCAVLALAPAILLAFVTIGSLYIDGVRSFNEAVLSDPTFTGRRDIWQFAIDNIAQRPWTGFGFGAFWETPLSAYQHLADGNEAMRASHAHNAFLELLLTVGIPGLVLGLLWAVWLPLADLQRAKQAGADRALVTLFVQIWLFALLTSNFESVLFNRGDPLWFTMLIAMFGLRYLSLARLTP